MDKKMYISLVRGFDWCVVAQAWQGYSLTKYILPDHFQESLPECLFDPQKLTRWNQELAQHIGEEFDYRWVPVGEPQQLTKEELEEMKNV